MVGWCSPHTRKQQSKTAVLLILSGPTTFSKPPSGDRKKDMRKSLYLALHAFRSHGMSTVGAISRRSVFLAITTDLMPNWIKIGKDSLGSLYRRIISDQPVCQIERVWIWNFFFSAGGVGLFFGNIPLDSSIPVWKLSTSWAALQYDPDCMIKSFDNVFVDNTAPDENQKANFKNKQVRNHNIMEKC